MNNKVLNYIFWQIITTLVSSIFSVNIYLQALSHNIFLILKVTYFQNEFMKSSFLQKNVQEIARISALRVWAEILAIFVRFLGEVMTS